MFDIGLQEMVLIGVLALLVFGPSKLPELGRMVGRALREFRRASDEFRSTVETNLNLNEPDHPSYTPAGMPSTESTPGTPVTSETLASETEAAAAGETTTAVATETEPSEPAEPFCAQRGSRLFHRRECSWVARIAAADRVPFKSVGEAREQGFATCPVCEPWEPG